MAAKLELPYSTTRRRVDGLIACACVLLACALCTPEAAAQVVLRSSLPNSPPMGYLDSSGNPQGFMVEALNEAAGRAGLKLDWRLVGDFRDNNEALRRNQIDLATGVASAERVREFYVSPSWWSFDLMVVVPPSSPVRDQGGLVGRRLAVPRGAVPEIARHYPGAQIIPGGSALEISGTVCSGGADAGVIAAMYLRELLISMPQSCSGTGLRALDSNAQIDYALISRREVAPAVRALYAALTAITADGTLAAIAAKHPPISTPRANRMEELLRLRYQRHIWTIALIGGAIVILLGGLLLVKQIHSRKRLRAINLQLEQDLQARERAETALRHSEARFRALFESAPQTVLAADRSGTIMFANRQSLEMFGRPELVGSNIDLVVPPRLRDRLREALENPGEPVDPVWPLAGVRADGAEFPIELQSGAVEADDRLTLAFITDISDRVALQQQLLQSQKLESVGQLAGGVAHDFNNLLTVIGGYAQLALQDLPPGGRLHESVTQISEAADRAASLTRQLLAFSRRQKSNPQIIALNELLTDLEKMLRRLIGEHLELILLTGTVGFIRADPGQIEQVVVNLAVNARDAMPEGGRIVIETANFYVDPAYGSGHPGLAPGAYVMLQVTDTGAGMSPEVQARIFEPFFTTKEKGTGLGLSTVYGIVKQAGGHVLVYSEPGRGSAFKVLLPTAEGGVSGIGEKPQSLPERGTETILLAEDEPGVRRFVREVLEANGYTVLEAANGREALDIALRHRGPIHALVSDMVMPEVGGAALADRMAEIRPGASILHMSGYSDRPSPGRIDGLIEKPFTPAALLQRIRETLNSRRHG